QTRTRLGAKAHGRRRHSRSVRRFSAGQAAQFTDRPALLQRQDYSGVRTRVVEHPMTPRAVVTGGAGFIGSHMVDLLIDRGFHVAVIDNLRTGRLNNLQQHRNEPRCEVAQLDMVELAPDSSLFRGAQYVFHFGGLGDIVPSIERPLDYMRANVMGTSAVLEAARHASVQKFVYAASSSCYGAAPDVPTTE